MKSRTMKVVSGCLFMTAVAGGCASEVSDPSEAVDPRASPTLKELGYTEEEIGQVTSGIESIGTAQQGLNTCKMGCSGLYGAACIAVSGSCAFGTVVTLGGVAVPCVTAVALTCGALAAGAEGCLQSCPRD